jgi:uncharacterized RDD family membrane protein YckC
MTVYPGAPSYASWGARVGGYLLDGLIQGIPYIVLGGIGAAIGGSSGTLLIVLGALASAGLWIYNRFIQGGGTGQTWGRKALGTRLVGEQTGQPIGAGMAFVRDLAHIVDSLICYIGWLFPLWDDKKQTIADKIVKTVVIQP